MVEVVRFPVEAVFGLHNWPGLAAQFAVLPARMMASADQFDITVRGHGAHAAMPHQGADPVVAGAALVQALQSIVSRTLDPLDAAVLSVTRFHAGDTYNIIPEQARLSGSFPREVQEMEAAAVQRIAAAHGVGKPTTSAATRPPQRAQRPNGAVEAADALAGAENAQRPAIDGRGGLPHVAGRAELLWLGNGLGEHAAQPAL
jgi:hippurate hydrolase